MQCKPRKARGLSVETAIPSFSHPLLHDCGQRCSAAWRGGEPSGHSTSGQCHICTRGWLLPRSQFRSGDRYSALMQAANSHILSSPNRPLLQCHLLRGNKCPPSAVSPSNLSKPPLKRSLCSAVHLKCSSSPGLRIMCHLPPTHERQQLQGRTLGFAQGADTSNHSGSRWDWCQPPGLQILTRLSQMLNLISLLEILIHLSNTPSYAAMVH